jgi:AraC-like DNA-binding protein
MNPAKHEFCVRVFWGPEAHYGPEVHSFCEIIVILNGRVLAKLPEGEVIAHPGDILFYRSGTVHEEWLHGNTPAESLVLAARWEACPENAPAHLGDRHGRMRNLLNWIALENLSGSTLDVNYHRQLVELAFAEYLRLVRESDAGIVELTRSYIVNHLAENFGLEELARNAELSKYHFVRVYRRTCGSTPMKDAQEIRLEFARQLLLATRSRLKEIAARVGISDEKRLSRLLRRKYGFGAREIHAGKHEMKRGGQSRRQIAGKAS